MKMLAIIALSLATALSGVMPAQAFPTVEKPTLQTTDVQQVQSHRRSWDRHDGNRRYYNRHHRRHGGYYRNHGRNNFGAAIGGFAAGAIIGGLLAQPRYGGERYYRGGSHADWCYARYRSYRAYDNTYQPYNGRRRQCISP